MGRKVFSLSVGLGPRATVYDAELFALVHASSKASAFVLDKPHIGEVFFSDSSSALRSVFDPSTHPGQRCLLLFRKNIIVQPARAALHNSQLVPWPLRSCRKRGGGHLCEEGLEAPAYDEGLYLLPPQTPRSNEGPAAVEKTVGERLPKVRRFRTGGCCPPVDRSQQGLQKHNPRTLRQSRSDRYQSRLHRRVLPTLRPDRIPLVHVYRRSL